VAYEGGVALGRTWLWSIAFAADLYSPVFTGFVRSLMSHRYVVVLALPPGAVLSTSSSSSSSSRCVISSLASQPWCVYLVPL